MKDLANQSENLQFETTPGFNVILQICFGFCEIHSTDARRLGFASVNLRFSSFADESLEAQLICGAGIWQSLGANESLVQIDISPHRRNGIIQHIMGGGGLEEWWRP